MELTTPVVAKGTAVIGGGSLGAYGVTELVKSGDKEEVTQSQPAQVESADTPKASVVINDLPLSFLFSKDDFGTSGDYLNSGTTFGYAFGRFVLDPDKNEEKWQEFERQVKSAEVSVLHVDFQKVKKGQNEGYKKIQDVCKEVYKKDKNLFFGSSEPNLSTNVWKYCSPFEWTPSSLGNYPNSDGSFLSKWGWSNSNQYYLLNVNNNDELWKHVFENLLKKDLAVEDKKTNIDDKFSSISSYEQLKNVCLEAYKSNVSDNESQYGNNARNYCLWDQSKNLSKYPTKP